MMRARIRTDRIDQFDVDPRSLWDAISDVARYPSWWSWLRDFDGTALRCGETWRCTVRPPAPYAVRLRVHLDEVTDHQRVSAVVSGDIDGTASVSVEGDPRGCRVRLVADLAPRRPTLRVLTTVAPRLARVGHDRVLDDAIRQFAAAMGCAVHRIEAGSDRP